MSAVTETLHDRLTQRKTMALRDPLRRRNGKVLIEAPCRYTSVRNTPQIKSDVARISFAVQVFRGAVERAFEQNGVAFRMYPQVSKWRTTCAQVVHN
jgi:hypothetical protein